MVSGHFPVALAFGSGKLLVIDQKGMVPMMNRQLATIRREKLTVRTKTMKIDIWDETTGLTHVATNWATYVRMMTNLGPRYSDNPEKVAAAIGRSIDAMLGGETDVLLTFENLFKVRFDYKLNN